MSEKTDLLDSISDDPETWQFLASALTTFMAVERRPRGRWSKRHVAEYISAHEDIDGRISDTTLGRFLDPASNQEPGLGTIKPLAAFLLFHDWIDAKDLELFGAAVHLRQMNELASFYRVSDTAAQWGFLDDLVGAYAGTVAEGRYFGLHRVVLRKVPDVPALIMRETFRSFDLGGGDHHWLPAQPSLSDIFRLPAVIRRAGGIGLSGSVNGGFLAAGVGIALALLRSEAAGFDSAIAVSAIVYDEEDVIGLKGTRSTGWSGLERGEFLLPERAESAANDESRAKVLAKTIDLMKFPYLRKRQKIIEIEDVNDVNMNRYIRNFLNMTTLTPEENTAAILAERQVRYDETVREDMSLDARLHIAYDLRLMKQFDTLLTEGADPNALRASSGLPLIFEIAAVGQLDWVEAVLASGRADLIIKDERGMRASFHAGVTAREAVEIGDPFEAKEYGDMYRMLLAEELRQLGVSLPDEP